MRLSQLVRELGEIGSVDLRVSVDLANEVVGVASPKRPFREIMDGVAAAVNGAWVPDGKAWILHQTKAHTDADQREETAYRKQRIESFLRAVRVDEPFTEATAQGLVAARQEYFKNNQPNAQRAALNGRSPASRFGTRLALAIGAEQLAQVSPNRTIVFSTQPNVRQRPLPPNVLREIYDEFVREQTLYVNAFRPATQRSTGSEGGEAGGNLPQGLEGMEFYNRPPTTVSKVLVVATGSILGGVSMQILMADRAGKVSLRIANDVRPPSSDGVWDGLDKERHLLEHAGWKDEFWNSKEPLSAATEAKLLLPADYEPHALLAEGGVRTWSRVAKKPVYVVVPDTLWVPSRPEQDVPQPTSLASFQLAMRVRCTVAGDHTRIIVRPKEPVTSRRMRADRLALQEYLKAGARPKMPALFSLLRKTSSDQLTFVSRQLQSAGRPLMVRANEVSVMRVAAMGDRAMGTVTFGEMSSDQRDAARFLIYEVRNWNRPLETLLSEPTEAFPDDLPRSARLAVQRRDEEGVRIETGPNYWTILRLDGSLDFLGFDARAENLKYQWGKFQHYTFNVEAHPLHRHVVRPSVIEELDEAAVSFHQLPAEFREAFERRLQELRRQLGLDGS